MSPRIASRRGRPPRDSAEVVFEGHGVSHGIAIGPAHVVESGAVDVPKYAVPEDAVAAERERFAAAVAKAQGQVKKLRAKAKALPASAAEELGYLLDAHEQMLTGSRLVRGVDRRIGENLINAEAAVAEELAVITQAFAAMNDTYMSARVQDVRDVGARLLRSLIKAPYQAFSQLPVGTVIIAEELTPGDTALMDPKRIAGFVTALGGAEDHTAIMARSLALPVVTGIPGLGSKIEPGTTVIVDGDAGRLIVDPTAATLTKYSANRAEILRRIRQRARLRNVPAITQDAVRIGLQANLELPAELEAAHQAGAEGIGLLRTEFQFMNRPDLPDEDEQYRQLRTIVEGMEGRPVTVRTIDVGNDKLPYSLGEHLAPSPNPALGMRAIRLSLRFKPLLDAQLAAILRAGAHGPVRILLPMICQASEVRQVREALDRTIRRLQRRRVKIADPPPPVGAMIEIPGAALAADSLARVCDFFSIGTNDLTMYTLAIDRGDEQVAHLYNPLHPGVLRLIQFTTAAALRARIPVAVCGELAGDERFTPLLLGLGIRELSMAPAHLLKVKSRIRSLHLGEASRRALTIMEQSDTGIIAVLLDDFNALA
ncbi:MAG: phosphoenolpyruvate--protein phosphotransferase [Alphaproteobacteria bacterium]|nr:phosphoenolpyruvate--protein phosphotransferase [Alphaproteobacteria bacterium]